MRIGTLLTLTMTVCSEFPGTAARPSLREIGGGAFGVLHSQNSHDRIIAAAIKPDAANHQVVLALHQVVAAGIGVAVAQDLLDLSQRDAVLAQAIGIGLDYLGGCDHAARGRNTGDAPGCTPIPRRWMM